MIHIIQATVLVNSITPVQCISASSYISAISRDFQMFLCCLQGSEGCSHCIEHRPEEAHNHRHMHKISLTLMTPHKTFPTHFPLQKRGNHKDNKTEKQFGDQQLKSLSMQNARHLYQLSWVQSADAVGEK